MGSWKAAIVALVDRNEQNRAGAATLAAHAASGGRLEWPRLPPHVSLKQPFSIEALAPVERYFDAFASSAAPLVVTLRGIEVTPVAADGAGPGRVVWVRVEESTGLRALHDRLNRELPAVVANAAAPFDGSAYEFHMSLGFLPASSPATLGGLPDVSGTVTLGEIALCLYDDLPNPGWQGICYKVLPLSA